MRAAVAAVVLVALAAVAQADPVVELGTYTINTNTPNTAVPVYGYNNPASGPHDSIRAFVLVVDISSGENNGGPVFVPGVPGQGGLASNSAYVGPASGHFTGGDTVTGTVFAGTNHINPVDGGFTSPQSMEISIGLISGPDIVLSSDPNARSLLATIYLSTVGVPARTSWALKIGGENVRPGVIGADGSDPTTDVLNFGNDAIGHALTDGVINVVPEPASFVMALLAVGGLGIVAVRRGLRGLDSQIRFPFRLDSGDASGCPAARCQAPNAAMGLGGPAAWPVPPATPQILQ